MTYGIYEVVGKRRYRDHPPGSTFEARLDRGAEARAVARGDIRLIRQTMPSIQPGSYRLPPGWAEPAAQTTEAPAGASLI